MTMGAEEPNKLEQIGNVGRWIAGQVDKSIGRELERQQFRAKFPRAGFTDGRLEIPLVDRMTDAELDELNEILEWNCFTVDSRGRRFGAPAKKGKREAPQAIPDPRILRLDQEFGLADKKVLEVGCFEGIHTIALARLAQSVTAIDARIENVVKTIVRCAMFGVHPNVFPWDLETSEPPPKDLECDVLHHVGVLYHLSDPVGHLVQYGATTRVGMMLDTAFAEPEQATGSYEASGRTFAYLHFEEGGPKNVFAGTRDHARWLTLDGLREALALAGFPEVRIESTRPERNGPRVLLFARRG